jgi:hypothetical protein
MMPFIVLAGNDQPIQNEASSFTPFYSEDFNGTLPAGWQTIDNFTNNFEWFHTMTGAKNGDSLSVAGTTASNGYMIYDSDSLNQTTGWENSDLISPIIDCSTHPTVRLNFNELLKYFNDTATVSVSNDGNSWTIVHNSSLGLTQNASTPNPNNVDIDISSIAGGQDTVYIKFNYRANYSYYWMIDDVQLYEISNTDVSLTSIIAPVANCTALGATEAVTVNIFNSGASAITAGYDVTFIMDGGTPVTEHVMTAIPPDTNLVYTFTGTADVSAPGMHTIIAYIVMAGDTNTANDTVVSTFFNGPHSVDYGTGFEDTDDFSGFDTEDVNNDSITWEISSIAPYAGSKCAQVASATADDWLFTSCIALDATIVYELSYFYRTTSTSTQADFQVMIGNTQDAAGMTQEIVPFFRVDNVFYLPGSSVFSVSTTGSYFVGFHVTNGDSLVGIRLDNILVSPDSGVGMSDLNSVMFSVFPNPSTGIVNLNSTQSSASGFVVEVINSIGELVSSSKAETLTNYTLNLQNHPSGVYQVRVISDKGITTRKVSISH